MPSANELLPLPNASFHILVTLLEGERHGYFIKREIQQRTRGQLNLGSGALYGSISRMLEQGLVEESDARPAEHLDDERRRYYRITAFGRECAAAEAKRMQNLAQEALAKLGRNPAETAG